MDHETLSLLDHFAAAALTGLAIWHVDRSEKQRPLRARRLAEVCYEIADAMMEERARRVPLSGVSVTDDDGDPE